MCRVRFLSGRVPDLFDELLLLALLLLLLLLLPAELLRGGVRGGRGGGGGARTPKTLLRGVEPPARILHPNAPAHSAGKFSVSHSADAPSTPGSGRGVLPA